MTGIEKLAGLAACALIAAGVLVAVQAARPSAQANRAKVAEASTHSCLDMNGKSFGWSWSNAPFASTCDAGPDKK